MRMLCLLIAGSCVLLFAVTPLRAQVSAADIERRVESILSKMSLEEKIDYLGGVDGFYIRSIPRLGVPRLKMADGPIGVRNYGPATAMAGGIALAATFDAALAERVGIEIGRDARAKGVHFLLGPGVNLYRAPMNGRNFEYMGEDPFLASSIAVDYIKGVQSQGVSATIKHFMGNNSEFDRHNTDSIIDERTMREIYLPVFEAAVKDARVGAIMTSYNLTNGAHMSEKAKLNTDIVKKEWGFSGMIMSDWRSTYDGVAAANGGLDLEMPSGDFMNQEILLPAIEQGKISRATIDDKIRRILGTAVRFGWLDRNQTDYSIPRYNRQGRQAALDAARGSMVLLKNEGNLLPLDKAKIKSIAVIGPDAYPAVPVGGGSARVEPFAAISFMEGLSDFLGKTSKVYYHAGIPTLGDLAAATAFSTEAANGQPGLQLEIFDNPELLGRATLTRIDQRISLAEASGDVFKQTYSARWSGYYTPQSAGDYDLFLQIPGEGISYRLYVDDRLLLDCWRISKALVSQASITLSAAPHKLVLEIVQKRRGYGRGQFRIGIARQGSLVDPEAKTLAKNADVVVVAAGYSPETESEGGDRTFRLPFGQDELIGEIAAANKNTIVVLTSGGSVDMNAWLDRIPALIEAWYPGQEGGTALAEILFGDINPSGRLPVTFERRWEDNPTHGSYYPEPGTNRVVYKEGVFVGYRGYERNGVKPLFPFGYGLSYTSFKYENLSIKPISAGAVGGASRETRYQISFDIINTGRRAGADVAQIYVGSAHAKIPRPAKELKSIVKVYLRPGEKQRVAVTLGSRAFCYYDIKVNQWHTDLAEFNVYVGRSSQQIELHDKIVVGALNIPVQ